jgi:hypothetical protein
MVLTPPHPEHAISVHNAAEGRQAVRSLKAMGADFVKVYDGVPKNAYFAIAAEAKQLHLPFVGHVPVRPWLSSTNVHLSIRSAHSQTLG